MGERTNPRATLSDTQVESLIARGFPDSSEDSRRPQTASTREYLRCDDL